MEYKLLEKQDLELMLDFVEMKKFLYLNGQIFERLTNYVDIDTLNNIN